MVKRRTSLGEVVEPFFLGVSCLVGGDNFSFLISHTIVSERIQSFLFICVAIIAILASAIIDTDSYIIIGFHSIYTSIVIMSVIYLKEKVTLLALVLAVSFAGSAIIKSMDDVVFRLTHWYYTALSATLAIFVCYKIKEKTFTTLLTIKLGCILPLLVVYSLSYYSKSRTGLLCFILGLFTCRFLPSAFWHLIDNKYDYRSRVQLVARSLVICRFLSALLSMMIGLLRGKFNLSMDDFSIIEFGKFTKEFTKRFDDLRSHYTDFWFRDVHFSWELKKSINELPKGSLIPFLVFLSYAVEYLALPPTFHSVNFCYSSNTISTISCGSMLFHLLGSCLGIGYPLSVSPNGYKFCLVNYIVCVVYILVTRFLYNYAKKFPIMVLYPIVIISGFVFGYLWAYNLGIFVNSVLNKGCKYEELKYYIPCCGDRINNVCYCKLPVIVKELNKVSLDIDNTTCRRVTIFGIISFRFLIAFIYPKPKCRALNMFSCSKSFKTKDGKDESLVYCTRGRNAILILYNNGKDICESIKKFCEQSCISTCGRQKCSCLKLVGVYKIDAITTSSCVDCQLTVRLDLSKSSINNDCNQCGSLPCCCAGQDGKCCCIAINCCQPTSCNNTCCCVKLCCCTSCRRCNCLKRRNGVRIFIAYNNSHKCCIKEIKKDYPSDFDGDVDSKTQFVISNIFISDCCHIDLQIDIHCKVKNNFFRLSGINYPRKLDSISSIMLMSRVSKCCKTQNGKCCCPYRELVGVCIMYNKIKEKCEAIGHPCSGVQNDECPKTCTLDVDKNSSYYKKIDGIRVKLIVVSMFVFMLLFFTTGSIVYLIRIKKSNSFVFKPNKSYSDLVGTFKSNKFNTEDQIASRISSLMENGTVREDVIKIKKTQVDNMLTVFKKYMGDEDSGKISNYVMSKSHSFLMSCKKVELRKVNVDLVIWSYSVGMVFKYVMLLFFDIQKFFVYWEEIWSIEYLNYRKFMKNAISQISRNSTCSLCKIDVRKMNDEKLNCLTTNRLQSWNNILVELKEFGSLIDEETDLYQERLPLKIGERLEFYVERWYHRLDFIKRWGVTEANIFNWDPFITEYNKISSWVEELSPFLETDSEVKFKIKDLNKGTKIFVNRKLK